MISITTQSSDLFLSLRWFGCLVIFIFLFFVCFFFSHLFRPKFIFLRIHRSGLTFCRSRLGFWSDLESRLNSRHKITFSAMFEGIKIHRDLCRFVRPVFASTWSYKYRVCTEKHRLIDSTVTPASKVRDGLWKLINQRYRKSLLLGMSSIMFFVCWIVFS